MLAQLMAKLHILSNVPGASSNNPSGENVSLLKNEDMLSS